MGESLDLAAEKFIGVYENVDAVSYDLQNDRFAKIISKYNSLEGCPIEMTLTATKQFLKLNQEAEKVFEEENKSSTSIVDLFGIIGSQIEETIYLLQQAKDNSNEE